MESKASLRAKTEEWEVSDGMVKRRVWALGTME